ncbi:GNAT family N-acetyltransferase [Peribacillus sp. NPDC097675]|uniref:GNAT family N-acetyltransferase n=1 Tax=Peribacillus sp. NPDC097675 TaxID=3390618 RepID=UPI003D05D57F
MLETNRCILSAIQMDDYDDVKLLYINEEVRRYLGGTQSNEDIQASFTKMIHSTTESLYFIVREKYTKAFIGLISLDTHHHGISTEVSYQLLPKWWGDGYATEAINEIINYAFNKLKLTEIVAETQTANRASCRLLEKLGFNLRETVHRFGEIQSIYCIKYN